VNLPPVSLAKVWTNWSESHIYLEGANCLMFKKTPLIFIVVVFLGSVQLTGAQQRPSTPEQRKQTVEMVTFLETSPLAKEAKDYRMKLFAFLVADPDITVKLCTNVLGESKQLKGDYSADLVSFQLMFSQAKFLIENPDKAQDDAAVYLAAVEGVLRTWEAIKIAKPKAKFPRLDELIQKREAGTLAEHVKAAMTSCR
jgi:hypothetical protein